MLLLPLIMVGQNVQGKHSSIRADEEYNATKSSYKDIEYIFAHQDAQDEHILQILENQKEQMAMLKKLTDKVV